MIWEPYERIDTPEEVDATHAESIIHDSRKFPGSLEAGGYDLLLATSVVYPLRLLYLPGMSSTIPVLIVRCIVLFYF